MEDHDGPLEQERMLHSPMLRGPFIPMCALTATPSRTNRRPGGPVPLLVLCDLNFRWMKISMGLRIAGGGVTGVHDPRSRTHPSRNGWLSPKGPQGTA
jgi:hypothetical protein